MSHATLNGHSSRLHKPDTQAAALRSMLIGQAHQILGQAAQLGGMAVSMRVTAGDDDREIVLTIGPQKELRRDVAPMPCVSQSERRILAVCTSEPQSPKRIASRLGKPRCTSRIYDLLRDLCRRGLLVRVPEGYRLADDSP